MLINGKWTSDWQPIQGKDEKGRFVRQTSNFRNWITPDGSPGPTGVGGFPAEAGRYRLYVALICPWASRTLMARSLKGLKKLIPLSVVSPVLGNQGWSFDEYLKSDKDPLFDAKYMHEFYTRADSSFCGRASVPILWDMKKNVLVNNESADILRMFNTAFHQLTPPSLDLYPAHLASDIDELNHWLYESLNNGVYRAGFASSQFAYDEAVTEIFETLDQLEKSLGDGRQFLFGKHFTEADIRLFVSLIRFDAVYYSLFKTNLRRIADYTALQAYMLRVLLLPGILETVNLDHIKAGYYSIKALNPSGIIPKGPLAIEEVIYNMTHKEANAA